MDGKSTWIRKRKFEITSRKAIRYVSWCRALEIQVSLNTHLSIFLLHGSETKTLEYLFNEQKLTWYRRLCERNFVIKEYSEDEILKRKGDLIEWLTKNRIPVTESSEDNAVLSVMGVLLVEPPYDPESCRCGNEIVLDRIQKLIRARKDHD